MALISPFLLTPPLFRTSSILNSVSLT
ncbi:hypothetical protein A1S_3667 [Acinetobacter baumannii ATCC 17978]|nr:hypothetical protein A1S_3667 [Acinetobacter baumannii ATCC 17978]